MTPGAIRWRGLPRGLPVDETPQGRQSMEHGNSEGRRVAKHNRPSERKAEMKVPQPDPGKQPEQPISDPLTRWPDFSRAVRARLDAGRDAYGDRSFDAEPAELAREICEELEDVAGWAFVLWTRIQRLEAAFSAQSERQGQVSDTPEGANHG